MSLQTEQILVLEAIRDRAIAALRKAMALNETIYQSRHAIPPVDVVRIWNIQVYAENALKNLELKAKGVSRLVRAA